MIDLDKPELEAIIAIREALAEEGDGVGIEEAFEKAENAVLQSKKRNQDDMTKQAISEDILE
jgi:hypothetical protein